MPEMSMEQMYKLALNPQIYPDARLLSVLQGKDNSLPMAVAMSAKQQRDKLEIAGKGQQGQGKKPTVRDAMLAQGMQQQQMAGLDQLPAPTMESMGEPAMGAGGGLVSFANGGFTDPDEDEQETDQEELDSLMARQGDLGGLGAGIMAVANPKLEKYSSIGLHDKVTGTPKDGVQALLSHIISKESGGRDFDEKGRPLTSNKGAKFAMQVLDSTAKKPGFGIEPAKNVSPEEYNRVGRELVGALHNKYQDPKLAAMAYNWGTGNVDKWKQHGGDEKAVPKETRMYVAGLAQGGIVSLAKGGKQSIADTQDTEDMEAGPGNEVAPEYISGLPGYLKRKLGPTLSGIRDQINTGKVTPGATWNPALQAPPPVQPTAAPTAAPTSAPTDNAPPVVSYEDMQKMQQQQGGPTRAEGATSFPSATDSSQSMIDKYLAGLEQSRKQAPGLALMAAGLGIAGQRSPYGLSNVGAGGLQGLQSYADMMKQNQAGEAAGLSAQAALDRNKVYAQHYATAAQAGQDAKYAGIISNLDKVAEDRIKNMTKFGNFNLNDPAQRQKAIDQIKNNMIYSNPSLRKYYIENSGMSEKDLYNMANPSLLSDTPTGTVRKPT